MQIFSSKWVPRLLLSVGTVIGIVKGAEARQKWVFKMKNRYQEKRQLAEREKLRRTGVVALDDIEIAAFHK